MSYFRLTAAQFKSHECISCLDVCNCLLTDHKAINAPPPYSLWLEDGLSQTRCAVLLKAEIGELSLIWRVVCIRFGLWNHDCFMIVNRWQKLDCGLLGCDATHSDVRCNKQDHIPNFHISDLENPLPCVLPLLVFGGQCVSSNFEFLPTSLHGVTTDNNNFVMLSTENVRSHPRFWLL